MSAFATEPRAVGFTIVWPEGAEAGFEQEFNSLDAQREACAAYVASHKAEGWVLLPTVYEDGGISGGTLERPGLQRLLADIDAGLAEQVVIYKVDRLTRCLADFAKLVERLEENHYFQGRLTTAPDIGLWDFLLAPVTKSYPFEIHDLAPVAESARLKVWLQGTTDLPVVPDHHVRVYLNGMLLEDFTLEGELPWMTETELLPGALVEGENRLELENVGDTGALYSRIMLSRFEVSYPRQWIAESGQLHGVVEHSGTAEVSGLDGGVCLLFIHPPAHGSEVSPAARNTLDSARIPRASKLLICGLFLKGRVVAQDDLSACSFHGVICTEYTPNAEAQLLTVRSPRSGATATFALNAARCCRRFALVSVLLSSRRAVSHPRRPQR